jgi:hypothetical protein
MHQLIAWPLFLNAIALLADVSKAVVVNAPKLATEGIFAVVVAVGQSFIFRGKDSVHLKRSSGLKGALKVLRRTLGLPDHRSGQPLCRPGFELLKHGKSLLFKHGGQADRIKDTVSPEFKLFGGGIFQAGTGVVGQWAKTLGE